jgi:mannose-6-phosphate isomerase-like protein (cupin superfamily)
MLAAAIFGVGPALQASRGDPLREEQRGSIGRGRRRAQRVLVVAEIALALVLSIGAGLLVCSLVRLQHVEPGFKPDRLLTFSLNLPQRRYAGADASRAFYTQLLERLNALPGVESAAVAVSLPPNVVTVTDNFTAMKKRFAGFTAGLVLGSVLAIGALASGGVVAGASAGSSQATGKSQSVAKVVLENVRVRVRDVTFPPGVTGMHTHELAHVGIVIQGGTLVFKYPDGRSESAKLDVGGVGFREANVTHEPVNTGSSPVRVIEVELK